MSNFNVNNFIVPPERIIQTGTILCHVFYTPTCLCQLVLTDKKLIVYNTQMDYFRIVSLKAIKRIDTNAVDTLFLYGDFDSYVVLQFGTDSNSLNWRNLLAQEIAKRMG